METPQSIRQHGAVSLGQDITRFGVWAPGAPGVTVHILQPRQDTVPMRFLAGGYWEAVVADTPPGTRYLIQIEGKSPYPDPASRSQPEGVHAASEVDSAEFEWQDKGWRAPRIAQCVFYELHTGTFTQEGTFDAIHARLPGLRDLGVNFIELMPVAQFPGSRNWGYDGVYPFAAQNSYGGPQGLRRLVNQCHLNGIGVALDVVYNHLGPEGNYLSQFGPYFTEKVQTPWGPAVNFDGPDSDGVRRYFIENALSWVRDFHIDALRIDAVHGIFDRTAYPFLEELTDSVRREACRLRRRVHVIAESDLNDPRLIRPKRSGGFGMTAQWADDFHHALRVLLTGDRGGYYQDFGELGQLAKAYREGYVYTGQYSSFRRRRHGASTAGIPAERFTVFSQNHDQVGNRMLGDRLAGQAPFEDLKLAAAAVILSPHVPLLFMGEEYGETAPFLYFVSHSDPALVEAVRRGRRREFAAFAWQGDLPDSQAESTFIRSKLTAVERYSREQSVLRLFYKQLLRLRRETPELACAQSRRMEVSVDGERKVMLVRRWHDDGEALLALCFSNSAVRIESRMPAGSYKVVLDSADSVWLGPERLFDGMIESDGHMVLDLQPRSATLLRREPEC